VHFFCPATTERQYLCAEVGGKHFELALYVPAAMIQPASGIEGVVEDKGAHVMALTNQRFSNVRTDIVEPSPPSVIVANS